MSTEQVLARRRKRSAARDARQVADRLAREAGLLTARRRRPDAKVPNAVLTAVDEAQARRDGTSSETITQRALVKRINRALQHDGLVLVPSRWSNARDAVWQIWHLGRDGGMDAHCIPLGPYQPSQLVLVALAIGALAPEEAETHMLDARGVPVVHLPWDGKFLLPEPVEIPASALALVENRPHTQHAQGCPATVEPDMWDTAAVSGPFADVSEWIETGL